MEWHLSSSSLESLKQKLQNYDKTLLTLEINIVKIKNRPKEEDDFDIYRDSTIKRFEYSLEVARKLMAKYIEYVDKKVNGQKLVLKKAFEFDLIEDDIWFEMIDDRNITTHEYSEALAMELLENIYIYALKLREFYNVMQREISKL